MDPNLNPIQPQNQLSNPLPIEPKSSGKLKWVGFGIFGILLIFLFGFLGYYLGSNEKKNVVINGIDSSPTISLPTITPISTPKKVSNIPKNWNTVSAGICGVTIPLPPRVSPYYIPRPEKPDTTNLDNNGYWVYEENIGGEMYTHSVMAIFRNPDLGGSEYIPGGVFVNCGPNTQKFTSETLVDDYIKTYITPYPDELTLKKRETVSLWGEKVIALTIQGGMFANNEPYYFLVKNDLIYQISKASMSKNNMIKQATQIIFDNLSF